MPVEQRTRFCALCFGEGGCNHLEKCVWIKDGDESENDPALLSARLDLIRVIDAKIRELLKMISALPERIEIESRDTVEVKAVDPYLEDADTEPGRPEFNLLLVENEELPDVDTEPLDPLPTFDDLFDDNRVKTVQDFLNALQLLSSANAYFVIDSKVAAVGRSERGLVGGRALEHEILSPKQLPVADVLQPLVEVWVAFEKYIDLFTEPINGPIFITSVRTMLGLSVPERVAQYHEEFIWSERRVQKGNAISLKERFMQLLIRAAEQKAISHT